MEYLQVAAKELSAVLMIIDWHLPLQYCDYNYCHLMCCSIAVRQMIFVLCSIYLTDKCRSIAVLWHRTRFRLSELAPFSAVFFCACM